MQKDIKLSQNSFQSIKPITKNTINKVEYLMIKMNLSNEFNQEQFKLITSVNPEEWIQSQNLLLKNMMKDVKFHQKYFTIFCQNHKKLLNWYYLATKNKQTIQPYIFKQVLSKKKQQTQILEGFKNQKLKKTFQKQIFMRNKTQESLSDTFDLSENFINEGKYLENQKYSNSNQESENASFMKPSFVIKPKKRAKNHKQKSNLKNSAFHENQLMLEQFFKNMIEMHKLQNKKKPLNLKLYKFKKKQNIDSHDLYMKTFDACNGRKYIYYDYQKHMQGIQEMGKYNRFLRGNIKQFKKENCATQRRGDLKITLYQQFEEHRRSLLQKQKCSLLPINMVLNQKGLNDSKCLQNIITKNKSNKVVFVNHQGKPITYYIKKDKKNSASKQTLNNLQISKILTSR